MVDIKQICLSSRIILRRVSLRIHLWIRLQVGLLKGAGVWLLVKTRIWLRLRINRMRVGLKWLEESGLLPISVERRISDIP